MTKYREIIRLTNLNCTQREIMTSCNCAQKTVVKAQKRARELNLSWPLDESYTDKKLSELFNSASSTPATLKKLPDFDYIRKERQRNDVSLKLL